VTVADAKVPTARGRPKGGGGDADADNGPGQRRDAAEEAWKCPITMPPTGT